MRGIKRVLAMMLVLVMMTATATALTTTVFALTDEPDNFNYEEESRKHFDAVSAGYFTTDLKSANTDEDQKLTVKINGVDYHLRKNVTRADLRAALENVMQTNEQSGVIREGMFNTEANLGAANEILSGFMPVLNIVIGVIIVIVTAGMTLFSAFDIAYIAFPVFRNKCEDMKANGGPMTGKNANGDVVLKFITQDAQYAVANGNLENGKSPWGIYFGKRVVSYVLLAIVIFILMTNNISLITQIALNLVSGIMGVVSGLA